MNGEYEVIKEFECCGKQMVIIRVRNAAHVMSQKEWHKIYGRDHQEKWETKVDLNSFIPENGYKTKVS